MHVKAAGLCKWFGLADASNGRSIFTIICKNCQHNFNLRRIKISIIGKKLGNANKKA